MAKARRSQIEGSIQLLNTLAEIRLARPCHYEFTHLSAEEQQEWVAEAAGRIDPPVGNAPTVCLLDTGINGQHPLLQVVLSGNDNHTIFGDADPSDSDPNDGHGTPMAGLAIYGDHRQLILGTDRITLLHRLEGVKMFDANYPHEPHNFGVVTDQAIHTPEITNPERNQIRVFAMAITAVGNIDGRPSSWSAAVDALAFGSEEQGEPKRLILISGGNTNAISGTFSYPAENLEAPIEDPAQAWNAITVGAITYRARILETDPESSLLNSVAAEGDLSPHSRTSQPWDAHWPIKPDIVMEGGNLGVNPQNKLERRDSLDALTTSKQIRRRPVVPFRATSAATALAARLAAQIRSDYPDLWPETIRGLMVHSARWNEAMLGGVNPHQAGNTRAVQGILRKFGFGEPDASRARASSQNEVTLFRQDQMVPYRGSMGSASINDCHIHTLNLPTERLQSLGETPCVMRVTLSYFTAPNPSASNRIKGSRYRYGGCLLRFRVRHRDESEENFLAQVARAADEEQQNAAIAENFRDPSWALGEKLRSKSGSLVHDIWSGSAADLLTMNQIAIFPIKGWWALRSFKPDSPWYRCNRRSIRYSLIVSLEVMADVPLYSEISELIALPVEV